MKLLRRSRTKVQASSDPRPTMTIEQALTSIAVELNRANKIAERQLQLIEANQAVGGTSDALRIVEKLIEPIGAMIAHQAASPPQVTSAPSKPPVITKEGNGTRVEQQPEA